MITYKNRYSDIYTFSKDSDNSILWEGSFEHHRIGYPNDYQKAYKTYLAENKHIDLKEFIEKVHQYDEENKKYPLIKYLELVKSNTNKINMIDPSGGPYIRIEMDMGCIDKTFEGLIVQDFINVEKGYKIIVKKTPITHPCQNHDLMLEE